MIRINFCRTGASVSDWEIDDKVARIKTLAKLDKVLTHHYSNMLLFDALRAEIAEGNLSLDNIQFSYEDEPIPLNKYGACNTWPRVCNYKEDYSARILRAALQKRKNEKKEDSNLAKTVEEGQAPDPA